MNDTEYSVCSKCGAVQEGLDVRQMRAPAEDLVDLLDASWKRSFSEPQLEFFRAALRVVWARAHRAGRMVKP